jgi:DNA-binding PadR family transcriptional regulator
MPSEVRITVAVALVLREFLTDVSTPRYGYDLMQSTGYPSGKLYPILARLRHAGWLARTAEDIEPTDEGRPARYLYSLTADGCVQARQELAILSGQLSMASRSQLRPSAEGSGA